MIIRFFPVNRHRRRHYRPNMEVFIDFERTAAECRTAGHPYEVFALANGADRFLGSTRSIAEAIVLADSAELSS